VALALALALALASLASSGAIVSAGSYPTTTTPGL
jgi:hypothetical protein